MTRIPIQSLSSTFGKTPFVITPALRFSAALPTAPQGDQVSLEAKTPNVADMIDLSVIAVKGKKHKLALENAILNQLKKTPIPEGMKIDFTNERLIGLEEVNVSLLLRKAWWGALFKTTVKTKQDLAYITYEPTGARLLVERSMGWPIPLFRPGRESLAKFVDKVLAVADHWRKQPEEARLAPVAKTIRGIKGWFRGKKS